MQSNAIFPSFCQTFALRVGLYVLHVQTWLDAFPREQLFVLRTEDYGKDVGGALLRVFQHLRLGKKATRSLLAMKCIWNYTMKHSPGSD